MEDMLDEKLKKYGESDFYPFHMPGHKRGEMDFPNPYKIDITEIEGFDDLHHSRGILQKAQWYPCLCLCRDKKRGQDIGCQELPQICIPRHLFKWT